jgi:hypothetical protein
MRGLVYGRMVSQLWGKKNVEIRDGGLIEGTGTLPVWRALPKLRSTSFSVTKSNFLCQKCFEQISVHDLPLLGFAVTFTGYTAIGRTSGEWSGRRRELYLTIHNTHNRETSMPTAWFEPTIPASERLQTHAFDCSTNGIGSRKKSWSGNVTVHIKILYCSYNLKI